MVTQPAEANVTATQMTNIMRRMEGFPLCSHLFLEIGDGCNGTAVFGQVRYDVVPWVS